MNDRQSAPEAYRTLQMMTELEQDDSLSQRELASRLGVAVGLVNSYLKNLTSKGFLRVKNYPRNRYAYLLTPKGLAEKSRLAYQHLHYFNNLYTLVRQDYLILFRKLLNNGADTVIFCGVDEVAEIAYLSLKEAGLNLACVVDVQKNGVVFVGHVVEKVEVCLPVDSLPVIITSLKRSVVLRAHLETCGVPTSRVFSPRDSD